MLSLSVVQEIDRLLQEGQLSQRKIAARLGVSRGTVWGRFPMGVAASTAKSRKPATRGCWLRKGRLSAAQVVGLRSTCRVLSVGHETTGCGKRNCERIMKRRPRGRRCAATAGNRLSRRQAPGGRPCRLPELGQLIPGRPPRVSAAIEPASHSVRGHRVRETCRSGSSRIE